MGYSVKFLQDTRGPREVAVHVSIFLAVVIYVGVVMYLCHQQL